MSFFSRLFMGDERCTECGAPSTTTSAGVLHPWEAALVPLEQGLENVRNFLDFRVIGSDPVCREDPRTNQLECQLYPGRGFRPENVQVNIRGRQVELKARQEQTSDDGQNYTLSEIRRTFTVPPSADVDRLTATMERDGRFVIRAPLIKEAVAGQEGPVPIQINRN